MTPVELRGFLAMRGDPRRNGAPHVIDGRMPVPDFAAFNPGYIAMF
jgi:hypothetical protein